MRPNLFASCLLTALALSCVRAEAAPPPANSNPDWVRKPTSDEMKALWPAQALRRGIGGFARIECTITITGGAAGCHVLEETPPGMGFGAAALALSPNFVFRPKMVDGQAVEAQIPLSIRFMDPGAPGPSRSHMLASLAGPTVRAPMVVLWKKTPSIEEMAAAWPAKAGDATAGHLVLRCGVGKDGRLHECIKLMEEPRGDGFEAAARKLVPMFQVDVAAMSASGPIGQVVLNVPFQFDNPNPPRPPAPIAKPTWTRQLSIDRMQQLFPAKAAKAGLTSGRAALDCKVGLEGVLTDCVVTSESPAGMEFGLAVSRVASVMAVSLWTADGHPALGQHVRFSMKINLDGAPDKPAAGG